MSVSMEYLLPEPNRVTIEDLTPAARQGLDNFRAWMREAKPFITYMFSFQISSPEYPGQWNLATVALGMVLASEPDFAKAEKAVQLAHQKDFWIDRLVFKG